MRISDWSSDVCSSDLPRYPPSSRRSAERVNAAPREANQSDHRRKSDDPNDADDSDACADPGGAPGLCRREAQRRSLQEPAVQLLRSEAHTSELQSLMRISYAVFCLIKKNLTIFIIFLIIF